MNLFSFPRSRQPQSRPCYQSGSTRLSTNSPASQESNANSNSNLPSSQSTSSPSSPNSPQLSTMAEEDHSTDFDDLDLGIDYDDPSFYSQLDSAVPLPTPAAPPPFKRPFAPPSRPVQAILRPPQPPAKKPRLEAPREEKVAPVASARAVNAAREGSFARVGREEEEMPEIRVEEGGYVRKEVEGVAALKRWGEGSASSKVASPKGKERVREAVASTSGLADDERRELEALRAEKAAVSGVCCVLAGEGADDGAVQLQVSLQAAQKKVDEVRNDATRKAGEISVVRGRLVKVRSLSPLSPDPG